MIALVTFLAGFSVMVLELVAARVLAPYLGTSLTVWTAVIGVVMVALSLGYWLGGRMADRGPSLRRLSSILHLAVFWILFSLLLQAILLPYLASAPGSLALLAVTLSVLLFGPSGMALAMVSPYVARLLLHGVGTAGATVGRLSAISTAGSLLGTFLTGFVLLEYLGSTAVQLVVAGVVFAAAVLLAPRFGWWIRSGLLLGVGLVLASQASSSAYLKSLGIRDVDTRYSRVRLQVGEDATTGRGILQLIVGNIAHAAVFTDAAERPNDEQLVYPYTKAYRLAAELRPKPERVLMLGGAAYTVPRDVRRRQPQSSVDVVEIDPGMEKLARTEFGLKQDLLLTSYLIDGRRFLNQAKAESGPLYDWILGDAFSSYFAIPFELTTEEAYQVQYELLQPGGVYVGNIVSAVRGPASGFLQAEVVTVQKVFGTNQVLIVPLEPEHPERVQNIMLIASKGGSFPAQLGTSDAFLQQLWNTRLEPQQIELQEPVLTDQFAPTEKYLQKMLDQIGR